MPDDVFEFEMPDLASMLEAAWRSGWTTGCGAGREDGRWDGTSWCDIDADWQKSAVAKVLRERAALISHQDVTSG